jgi:hypothetical protein
MVWLVKVFAHFLLVNPATQNKQLIFNLLYDRIKRNANKPCG